MELLGRKFLGDWCILFEGLTWNTVDLDASPLTPPEGLCRTPFCLWKWLLLQWKKAMEAKKIHNVQSRFRTRWLFPRSGMKENLRKKIGTKWHSYTLQWPLKSQLADILGFAWWGWEGQLLEEELPHWGSWDCAQGELPKAMGYFYGTLAWVPGFWARQGQLVMSPQLDTLIAAHPLGWHFLI